MIHDDDFEPHDEGYEEHYEERPSKSEMKRRMDALQKAGESLIGLPAGQLAKMPLPDELRKAVQQAANMRTRHPGFKRQRQYIGRLMREIDATPILEALNDLETAHRTDTARFHEIEFWRDALLSPEGAGKLTEFLAEHPGTNVQQLRNQISRARKEQQLGRSRHAQRELFAMLRGIIDNR